MNQQNTMTRMNTNINTNDIYLSPVPRLAGEWNIKLCDKCCSPSSFCMMAWCCPCFPLAQLFGRVSNLNINDYGFDERNKNYQNAFYLLLILALISLLTGVNFIFQLGITIVLYITRKKIQQFYHIRPSTVKDIFVSCCCVPCSLLQLASQVWESPESIGCCQIDETPVHWSSVRAFQGDRLDMEISNHV